MMGASSDKTIRIFASVSNWGSEQCTGHQKKRSGTSPLLQGGTFLHLQESYICLERFIPDLPSRVVLLLLN